MLGREFSHDCIATLHHDLSLATQSHWAAGTPLPFVLLLAEQNLLAHSSSSPQSWSLGHFCSYRISPVTESLCEVKMSPVVLHYCPGQSIPLTMATAGQRKTCLTVSFKRSLKFSSSPVENGPSFPISLGRSLLHHPGPCPGPAVQVSCRFPKADSSLPK